MSEHHVEKKKVMRFPRENATLAALDAKALAGIERGRKVNIEVGHIFREIKAEIRRALGHGHWRQHFKDTFVPRGISLRTAQEWMRMARKREKRGIRAFGVRERLAGGSRSRRYRGSEGRRRLQTEIGKACARSAIPAAN